MTRKKGDGKAADTRYQSPLESQRRATQEQTFAMNLTVLQRMDPTVIEICDMAGHAVVYKFDLGTQGWSKLDIEGSLFIVRRMSGYRLIVLNRSGIENYELDITAGTLVQLQGPYLMCRASQAADVIGLWFYKEDEHASISRLVQDLVNHCQNGGIPPQVPSGAPVTHPSLAAPPAPGRPPLPPQASSAAAADQAGADLRGMLGIGGVGAGGAGAGVGGSSPPLDAAKQATNDLMTMLNIGGAAAASAPLAPSVQAHVPPPQPSAPQPPSPGANIMAMLGVGGGGSGGPSWPPSGAVVQPAEGNHPPLPQGQSRHQQGAGRLDPHAPAGGEPGGGQGKSGGKGATGGDAGAIGGEVMTPAQLLNKSVAHTLGKAAGAVAPMSRAQFKQALQAAVADDAFVDELYRQYMV